MTAGVTVHESGRALIDDPGVDAVVVTSWEPRTRSTCSPASRREKQAFCEKPLATTREACDRIIDAEVAIGRRLVSVGFMRRYGARSTGDEGVVTSGKIGAPLMMHAAHRNPSLPEFVLAFDAEFQARIDAVTAGGTTGPSA